MLCQEKILICIFYVTNFYISFYVISSFIERKSTRKEKKKYLFGPHQMLTNPKRCNCLDFKTKEKISQTRNIAFLRNDCECANRVERKQKTNEKPRKIQATIKPSVLFGFLRQKGLCSVHSLSE